MPTNPLWVEHTEKAAWDTVQTLRAEIERANKRLEQLVELKPQWPQLLERLERACLERGLTQGDAVAMLDALLTRLNEVEQRDATVGPPPSPSPPPPAPAPAAPRSDQSGKLSPSVRWFSHLLERRRGRGRSVDPSQRARLSRELEGQLEELSHSRAAELLDTAVEIGVLALELARIGRRARSE